MYTPVYRIAPDWQVLQLNKENWGCVYISGQAAPKKQVWVGVVWDTICDGPPPLPQTLKPLLERE